MLVLDAQVHAPNVPNPPVVTGIDYEPLIAEMARAGVDGAVLVPLGIDADPGAALAFVDRDPDKFTVMARPPITDRHMSLPLLESWRSRPGVSGIRVSFLAEPARTLLADDRMDWLWEAAERLELPVMINAAGNVEKVGRIAERYPNLRLALDHLGIPPFQVFDDLLPEIEPALALAGYENVSVKASALPCSVAEPYPFPSLHEPLRRVIDAFGSRRVFWGSDLTRLPCTYAECRKLFTDELRYPSDRDLEMIMGSALADWLGWTALPS